MRANKRRGTGTIAITHKLCGQRWRARCLVSRCPILNMAKTLLVRRTTQISKRDLLKRVRHVCTLEKTAHGAGDQAREAASSLGSEAQERFQGIHGTSRSSLEPISPGGSRAQSMQRPMNLAAPRPHSGPQCEVQATKSKTCRSDFATRRPMRFLPIRATLSGTGCGGDLRCTAATGFVAYRVLNVAMTKGASGERPSAGYDNWRRPSSEHSRTTRAGVNPDHSVGHIHGD